MKMFLRALLFSILASITLSQAFANDYQGSFGGAKGEWIVQPSRSGYTAGTPFNVCILDNGAWYISSVYRGWKGKYHNPGMPLYMYAINAAGTGTFTLSLLVADRTGKRMTGVYMRSEGGKVDYNNKVVLTYKGPACAAYRR